MIRAVFLGVGTLVAAKLTDKHKTVTIDSERKKCFKGTRSRLQTQVVQIAPPKLDKRTGPLHAKYKA